MKTHRMTTNLTINLTDSSSTVMESKASAEEVEARAPRLDPSPANMVRRRPHSAPASPGKAIVIMTLIGVLRRKMRQPGNSGYQMIMEKALLPRDLPRHRRRGVLNTVRSDKGRSVDSRTARTVSYPSMMSTPPSGLRPLLYLKS